MNDKMKKRIVNRVGDIYCVTLDDSKVYLQYVAKDETQLYSPVVRVFKKRYAPNEVVDLEDVVCGEVWFYAHTMLQAVLYEEYWKKVGSSKNLRDTENRINEHLPAWLFLNNYLFYD